MAVFVNPVTHVRIGDNRAMSEIEHNTPTPATVPVKLGKSDENLVWLDCEMSGLDPEKERLLEIAVVITSPDLSVRVESPVYVIHQSDAVLDGMDAWNKGTHGRSGLIDKVKASTMDEAQVEAALLAFIKRYVPKAGSPMCGNTISQDRRFLVKYMPKFEAYFHYRCLDVSTLKELAKRWHPEIFKLFKKQQAHTALADVHESIDELVHYRTHFLRMPATN